MRCEGKAVDLEVVLLDEMMKWVPRKRERIPSRMARQRDAEKRNHEMFGRQCPRIG